VFTTRDAFVAVELTGTWTAGMTYTVFDPERSVPDVREAAGRRPRTKVATELDKDRFWDLVVDALANLTAAKG
jgi:inosine-uridine nucleoside N-ribohydrolase